ncbi:unnamed protein product [Urochloa humidicola]
MDLAASSSSRFSKEEDEEEEQEEEDEEASPREIPFMTAAGGAGGAAASSSSSPPPAAAAASASDPAAALRSGEGGGGEVEVIEKEHMFDKVVTPSDVGKLNRLVIPKQHAEKYFPLDAAAGSEKGLLLSFEDRAGKLWRFRYSYWNSSQSYVMTKGWSRFVKEKRLDAGDTVSFCRGAGDAARDRLFIDWKRRADSRDPHHHHRMTMPRLPLPMAPLLGGASSPYYGPWAGGGAGGFFMPPAPPATLYEHHRFRQGLDFRNVNAAAPARQLLFFGSAGMPPRASMPPPPPPLHNIVMVQPPPASPAAATSPLPMVLDSEPLAGSPTAAAKRVRLFGVNLDNPQPASVGGGESSSSSQDTNALSLRMPGWQRPGPWPSSRLFLESPQLQHGAAGAESSAASSPSSSSSSKREAHSSLDLDL